MKVLLLNGSPHKEGCTYTALCEVGAALNREGVETEFLGIGTEPQRGCVGCGQCYKLGKCVWDDDLANRLLAAIRGADGLVIGSPVYFAAPNGILCALLDRVFYAGGKDFAGKVGCAVVSARRAGTTAALDRLYKYLHYAQMPIATSQYWNMVHGVNPGEVAQDAEGLQIMRLLGANMAWMLKGLQNAPPPQREKPARTNFIR